MKALLALLLLAAPARALEISLEENRQASGNIGFVDMKKVFEALPATRDARTEFEGEVRRRDQALSAMREDLRSLRRALEAMEAERGLLLSTQAATPPPALSELPGLSTFTVVAATAPIPLPALDVQAVRRARLEELDRQLPAKRGELAAAEASLREKASGFERELAELERDKSRTLMGRAYRLLQEVAKEAQVSVVVDRASILFGHQAVDLTDELIQRLKESP